PADPPADPSADPTPPTDPVVKTGPLTTVSLTFDDGNASQALGASILGAHGLVGTFYINSGTIGTPGKLTLAQLQAFAAAGNEIGGHTVTHVDLTTVPNDEVLRQVCDDRVQLSSWGFQVRSFAYPFAEVSNAVAQDVMDCGYNSGRLLGDIRSRFGCAGCDWAESVPPARPAITQALDQFDLGWTLDDLEGIVLAAEAHGGGWLQFTFHDVCTGTCGELAIDSGMLDAFASWLQDRGTTHNTVVRTVGDVIGGPVKPLVAGPAVPPPTDENTVINPSLETMQNGFPACWYQAPWGDNDASFSLVSPGHSGSVASQVTITQYGSGEGKIIPTLDLGACAPSVTTGHSYVLSGWYKSTGVTQFAVYLRTTTGAWIY
ncbi:polysaccharide deacetylase family protein, partial [Schumannella luteola]